ncbi:class I SAM-dependent methyltransferase [Lysobacter pythonis]|uniref:Class I SAM-dependent methyltransferase n=1 Tax=Solilutibacter pythonis TaxID=2483112 RepID=A0A3M2I3N3_9GAMM|nr:methyltransferase [Lysobacter pythonis]RMH92824.1 class I SAM-dependent methyltransferase [Lysobacter pythonis]
MKPDPALDALCLPFAQGLLHRSDAGTLFLHGREGAALHAVKPPRLTCVQPFKPWADALQRAGIAAAPQPPAGARHAQVWLLPPRQRESARALLAAAFDACEPGGRVVVSVANDEGAKALEGDFRKLAGALDGGLSKYHCRVFWAKREETRLDAALLAQWRRADAPRPILDGRFISRPGVFAWDRIDAGSALLAEHLPANLCGRAADLGAGWGFLADALLTRSPAVSAVDLFEADHRALALARENLAAHGEKIAIGYHWRDVTAGLPAGAGYDVIVSNPPFHDTGKSPQPQLGQRFIAAAADALSPAGAFWLVANAHLPYEALLGARFGRLRGVAASGGYKVIEAREPRR